MPTIYQSKYPAPSGVKTYSTGFNALDKVREKFPNAVCSGLWAWDINSIYYEDRTMEKTVAVSRYVNPDFNGSSCWIDWKNFDITTRAEGTKKY